MSPREPLVDTAHSSEHSSSPKGIASSVPIHPPSAQVAVGLSSRAGDVTTLDKPDLEDPCTAHPSTPEGATSSASATFVPSPSSAGLSATALYSQSTIVVDGLEDLPKIKPLLTKAVLLLQRVLLVRQTDCRLIAVYRTVRDCAEDVSRHIDEKPRWIMQANQVKIQSTARFTEYLFPYLERQIAEDKLTGRFEQAVAKIQQESDTVMTDTEEDDNTSDAEDSMYVDEAVLADDSYEDEDTADDDGSASGNNGENSISGDTTLPADESDDEIGFDPMPVRGNHARDGVSFNRHAPPDSESVASVRQAMLAMAQCDPRDLLYPAIQQLRREGEITDADLEHVIAGIRAIINTPLAPKPCTPKIRMDWPAIWKREAEERGFPPPPQWNEDESIYTMEEKTPGTPTTPGPSILRQNTRYPEDSEVHRADNALEAPQILPLPKRRITFPKQKELLQMPPEADKSFIWKRECRGLWAYFEDDRAFNNTQLRLGQEAAKLAETSAEKPEAAAPRDVESPVVDGSAAGLPEPAQSLPSTSSQPTDPGTPAKTIDDAEVSVVAGPAQTPPPDTTGDLAESSVSDPAALMDIDHDQVQPQDSISEPRPSEAGPSRRTTAGRAKRNQTQASPKDWGRTLRSRTRAEAAAAAAVAAAATPSTNSNAGRRTRKDATSGAKGGRSKSSKEGNPKTEKSKRRR